MVADALIYHPVVDHYLKFVATTVGRDKVLRTIQYFSRFLAWYTYRTNHTQATVDLIDNIKKNFSVVRKAMRIGKFVEHFKAAARAADSKTMEPFLRYLAVGRQLGYAFYLFLDTCTYPDASGIRKYEGGAKVQKEAYRFWLMGLTCNIVSSVYTLLQQRKQIREHEESADAEKAAEIKKVTDSQRATQIQLLSDICDATVPIHSIGLLPLDDGIVGLAGTCSSLIGLSAQWEKTAGS